MSFSRIYSLTLSLLLLSPSTHAKDAHSIFQSTSKGPDLLYLSELGHSCPDHLPTLLLPRVSDTPANTKVKNYIVDQLSALDGYEIQQDQFYASTPQGKKSFTNIIGMRAV
jgi:hypothetical protein